MTTWNRPFPPSSPAQIEQFEKRIGASLPQTYRTYLMSQNGGYPSGHHLEFRIPDIASDKGRVMLGGFYGIGKRGSGLDLETQCQQLDDEVPPGHVPIGEDPGGNLLLVALHEPSEGEIFYWDRAGFLAKEVEQNWFRLANDINQFLESLRVIRDD